MRQPALTPEQKEEVRQLHEQGCSLGEIADKYGCGITTISKTIHGNPQKLKLTDDKLTSLEINKGVIIIEADFYDTAAAVDVENKAMWLIDRMNGRDIEMDPEKVPELASFLVGVAETYFGIKTKKGA